MKSYLVILALVILGFLLFYQFDNNRQSKSDFYDKNNDAKSTESKEIEDNKSEKKFVGIPDLIEIKSPTPGQLVNQPISLSGKARGYWFFEASAPVTVTNWDGLILGEGYITATENWMTEDFVPFTGELSFTPETNSYSATGTLIFRKDNPSGLPENDQAFEMTIQLPQGN